jgi:hypothetical protein
MATKNEFDPSDFMSLGSAASAKDLSRPPIRRRNRMVDRKNCEEISLAMSYLGLRAREESRLMKPQKFFVTFVLAGSLSFATAPAIGQHAQSDKLFAQIYNVLTHPRCLNCHPKGDSPKQGLDAHVHVPPVARGTHDKGVPGLQCAACHQTRNYAASGVPGAPNWHLAPLSMAWEDLSQGELCRALLDKRKNGNKDLKAIVEHMTRDELVAWGWTPGIGADGKTREPAPITKPEFDRVVHAWAKLGGKCPE